MRFTATTSIMDRHYGGSCHHSGQRRLDLNSMPVHGFEMFIQQLRMRKQRLRNRIILSYSSRSPKLISWIFVENKLIQLLQHLAFSSLRFLMHKRILLPSESWNGFDFEFIVEVGKIVGHTMSGGNGLLGLRDLAAIAQVLPGSIMRFLDYLLSPYPKARGYGSGQLKQEYNFWSGHSRIFRNSLDY